MIPYLNGPGNTPWEMLGDRDPRKSLLLQLTDLRVILWSVSRPPRSRSRLVLVLRGPFALLSRRAAPLCRGNNAPILRSMALHPIVCTWVPGELHHESSLRTVHCNPLQDRVSKRPFLELCNRGFVRLAFPFRNGALRRWRVANAAPVPAFHPRPHILNRAQIRAPSWPSQHLDSKTSQESLC